MHISYSQVKAVPFKSYLVLNSLITTDHKDVIVAQWQAYQFLRLKYVHHNLHI